MKYKKNVFHYMQLCQKYILILLITKAQISNCFPSKALGYISLNKASLWNSERKIISTKRIRRDSFYLTESSVVNYYDSNENKNKGERILAQKKISNEIASARAKALSERRLRAALDRRCISYPTDADRNHLECLLVEALENGAAIYSNINRLKTYNFIDVQKLNEEEEENEEEIDVDSLSSAKVKEILQKTSYLAKSIAKKSTRILYVKGRNVLNRQSSTFLESAFEWNNNKQQNIHDYDMYKSSRGRRAKIRKNKSSAKLLLLPPVSTATILPSSNVNNATMDVSKEVKQREKQYKSQIQRKRQKLSESGPATSTTRTKNSQPRYWKDKMNKQLDYAFGIYNSKFDYNRWAKIDNNDANDELYEFLFRQKRQKPQETKSKPNNLAFWEEEGTLFSLFFGKNPMNGEKLTMESLFKRELSVTIMTSLFKSTFRTVLIVTSYICRWASVRGALPQPIIVFSLITSALCSPRRNRFWAVFFTIIACRTIAEALHGYKYGNEDWEDGCSVEDHDEEREVASESA